MANKSKTRVILPGGIQGLVHNLQTGTASPALQPKVDVSKINDDAEDNYNTDNNAADAPAHDGVGQGAQQTAQQPAAQPQQSAAAEPVAAAEPAADAAQRPQRGRRPKENTMKEYTVVKDDSRDSWDLFLDMARQYKDGGGRLATIYIDESLKNVLDRMKYCGPEKLSTSAILSSIVARFIFDHEEDIKKVMFSGKLI